MSIVYITRSIPESGMALLRQAGHEVVVSDKDRALTKDELINELTTYNPDAVIPLLTDDIDEEVFEAAPNAKIFATYSVGVNHIDLDVAKLRGVAITNTPGVLTDAVAEYTVGLICAISRRISEADRYTRSGEHKGWDPILMLGSRLRDKTLGIIGMGRIGSRVAEIMHKGFGMRIEYYDVRESKHLNLEINAHYNSSVEDVLRVADVVTVHVPLLRETRHLINKERLEMMKSSAYLVNTSRGAVVDEVVLRDALTGGTIRGAALDVFEFEPDIVAGLEKLENVILTPHIASATEETRNKMSKMAAKNVIAALSGQEPPNKVA